MSFSILLRQPARRNDSRLQVGGRLQDFLPYWASITENQYILNMLAQGYNIEFSDLPLERYLVTNLPRDVTKSLAMKSLLKDLIDQGVMTYVPQGELYQGLYS